MGISSARTSPAERVVDGSRLRGIAEREVVPRLTDRVDQVNVHVLDERVVLERVEAEVLPEPALLVPPWGISDTRGKWSLISTAPNRSAFATWWARCTSLVHTEL